MRNKFLVLFLLSVVTPVYGFNEPKPMYVAASIKKESSLSLEKIIKFPKEIAKSEKDAAVVVRCDAFITRNGKVSSNMCYEGGDVYYPYVTAINRAAKNAVFNPGKVNGSARIVYFQYYVLFIKKGAVLSIEVIGNSGLEVEKYGVDYSSPQRYRESGGDFGSGCGINKEINVNAIVSEAGMVSDIDVVGDDLGDSCIKYLKKTFKGQKFIPALYKGKPISSFYSERIFNVMRQQ